MLAVFLSCPLERGGSQLERGARGYALSPLCGETHGGLERLSAGAERKSEREHTWGGFFFFPHKSQACFLRGLFSAGTFVVGRTDLLEVHYTGGRERALSFLSNSQRHLVIDAGCQNKYNFQHRGQNAGQCYYC